MRRPPRNPTTLKRPLTGSMCVVACALVLVPQAARPAAVIAHAEQQVEILPRRRPAPDEPEVKITVKLIRVIPRTGNNPLNRDEPVNNRDGEVVTEDEEPAFTPLSAPYGQPNPGTGAVNLSRSAEGK